MKNKFWRMFPSLAYVSSLVITLLALQPNARGQSDDFNDGDDNGWTRFDLSAPPAGFPASTYSFPDDGSGGKAYRIFSPAPPSGDYGPARFGSFQTNVYSDFYAAVDL